MDQGINGPTHFLMTQRAQWLQHNNTISLVMYLFPSLLCALEFVDRPRTTADAAINAVIAYVYRENKADRQDSYN